MNELSSHNYELIPPGDNRAMLAYPMEVVPTEAVKRLARMNASAMLATVNDVNSYQSASELMQALQGEIKAIAQRVTELRRPFAEAQDRISAEAKENPALMMAQAKALPAVSAALNAWLVSEREREQREKAEARRIQEENERKAREAAAARAKAEADMHAAAEAKQRQAERLRFEAEENERKAVEDAEKAGNSAKARLKLAQELAANAERDRLAEAAQAEADELARKLAYAQAAPVEVEQAVVPEVVQTAIVRGGAKLKDKPVIDGFDLSSVPLEFHLLDEKKTLKALEMGLKVPGVRFRMVPVTQAARGALK